MFVNRWDDAVAAFRAATVVDDPAQPDIGLIAERRVTPATAAGLDATIPDLKGPA